jgi:hypothetical protein
MEVHLPGILAQEGGPLEVVFTSTETNYLWVIFGISLLALVFAYYLVREVLAAPEGTERMKEIARAIQEGAKAYLSRQFRTLGIFLALLTVLLTALVLRSGYDAVVFNKTALQSPDEGINTCGRHCAVRLMYKDLSLPDYIAMFRRMRINPDFFVTALTMSLFEHPS